MRPNISYYVAGSIASQVSQKVTFFMFSLDNRVFQEKYIPL